MADAKKRRKKVSGKRILDEDDERAEARSEQVVVSKRVRLGKDIDQSDEDDEGEGTRSEQVVVSKRGRLGKDRVSQSEEDEPEETNEEMDGEEENKTKEHRKRHVSLAYLELSRVTRQFMDVPKPLRHWLWFEEYVLRISSIRITLLELPELKLDQFLVVMKKLFAIPTRTRSPARAQMGAGDLAQMIQEVQPVFRLSKFGPMILRVKNDHERNLWLNASFRFYQSLLSPRSMVELVAQGEDEDGSPAYFDVVAKVDCASDELVSSLWGERVQIASNFCYEIHYKLTHLGYPVWGLGSSFYMLAGPVLLVPQASSNIQLDYSKPQAMPLKQTRPTKATRKGKQVKAPREMLCAQVIPGVYIDTGEKMLISHPPHNLELRGKQIGSSKFVNSEFDLDAEVISEIVAVASSRRSWKDVNGWSLSISNAQQRLEIDSSERGPMSLNFNEIIGINVIELRGLNIEFEVQSSALRGDDPDQYNYDSRYGARVHPNDYMWIRCKHSRELHVQLRALQNYTGYERRRPRVANPSEYTEIQDSPSVTQPSPWSTVTHLSSLEYSSASLASKLKREHQDPGIQSVLRPPEDYIEVGASSHFHPELAFGAYWLGPPQQSGTIIALYYGTVTSSKEVKESTYTMQIGTRKIWIDASTSGGASRYANHSCEPNCVFVEVIVEGVLHIGLAVVGRTLEPADEILVHYGWSASTCKRPRSSDLTPCHCGSGTCTGHLYEPAPQPGPPEKLRSCKRWGRDQDTALQAARAKVKRLQDVIWKQAKEVATAYASE